MNVKKTVSGGGPIGARAVWKLQLGNCAGLRALPDSIGGCVKLTSLDLSHCTALGALPDSIGGCVNLQTLNVRYCAALTALPTTLRLCVALRATYAPPPSQPCPPHSATAWRSVPLASPAAYRPAAKHSWCSTEVVSGQGLACAEC